MTVALHPMYTPREADEHTTVRVGVGVAVCDEQDRVLLEKRSDCGIWGLPGGRIEAGESINQAAVREIEEETGLTVKITRLIGVYSEPAERIVTYPDNIVHLVDIFLEAKVISGELTRSEESEELRFFHPSDLPDEVVPPGRVPLQDFLQGYSGVIR